MLSMYAGELCEGKVGRFVTLCALYAGELGVGKG